MAAAGRASVAEIARARGCEAAPERPLREHTSLGVGGPAEWLVTPSSAEVVGPVLADLLAAGIPVRVLGNGSNVLVSDSGVRGVVLRLNRLPLSLDPVPGGIRASASWAMPALARAAAERGLSGLEWAEGVPGSLGGALVMNAGAYGHETAEVAASARVVGKDGIVRERALRRSEFGYRSSPLSSEEPILDAVLRLAPDARERILERMGEFRAKRTASQPVRERSAGCIFRNPPGDSAGRLVDAAGFKGAREGGARVSEAHGNFFVNDGSATAADFDRLIRTVREGVRAKTGVLLEEEVVRWGDGR